MCTTNLYTVKLVFSLIGKYNTTVPTGFKAPCGNNTKESCVIFYFTCIIQALNLVGDHESEVPKILGGLLNAINTHIGDHRAPTFSLALYTL